MKRFVKLTALFAVIASLSVLSNESFARGHAGGRQVTSHRIVSHRVNQYNGIDNPNKDPNYPSPNGPGSPTGSNPIGGGNPNPVKPHPIPVLGLQPVAFPSGGAKSN
jgi:hypothetical protein